VAPNSPAIKGGGVSAPFEIYVTAEICPGSEWPVEQRWRRLLVSMPENTPDVRT